MSEQINNEGVKYNTNIDPRKESCKSRLMAIINHHYESIDGYFIIRISSAENKNNTVYQFKPGNSADLIKQIIMLKYDEDLFPLNGAHKMQIRGFCHTDGKAGLNDIMAALDKSEKFIFNITDTE